MRKEVQLNNKKKHTLSPHKGFLLLSAHKLSICSFVCQAKGLGIKGIYVHINQDTSEETQKPYAPECNSACGFLKEQQQSPWGPSSIPVYSAALRKESSRSVSPCLSSAVTFYEKLFSVLFECLSFYCVVVFELSMLQVKFRLV